MPRGIRNPHNRGNPLVFVNEMMRLGAVRQLSNKALEFLGKCVTEGQLDTGEQVKVDVRVTAARAIVHYSMWREQWEMDSGQMTPEAVLELIAGSDEGLLKWIDQARPKLVSRIEARIQARALAAKSFDPTETGTSS